MNLLELIDKLGNHLNRMDQRIEVLERKTNPEGTLAWNRLCDDVENLQSKVEDLDSTEVLLADDFQSNFEESLGNMTTDEILSEDAIREAVRDILRNATIEV